MRKYKVKVSRVYGNGYSYNLTNQHDAERLCQTLNELENTVQLHSYTKTVNTNKPKPKHTQR